MSKAPQPFSKLISHTEKVDAKYFPSYAEFKSCRNKNCAKIFKNLLKVMDENDKLMNGPRQKRQEESKKINDKYNSLIAAAKKEKNTKEVEKLEKQRQKEIDRTFTTYLKEIEPFRKEQNKVFSEMKKCIERLCKTQNEAIEKEKKELFADKKRSSKYITELINPLVKKTKKANNSGAKAKKTKRTTHKGGM